MTPLKTFICYAHEDRPTVEGLLKHLRLLEKKELLEIWDDGQILPGQDWDKSIKRRLENAQLILMFVSVDFISSEYIETTELKAALQRHTDGEATLVPIIVRSCDWADYFEIGRFQALPKQAHPIHSRHFTNLDEALHEVAQGIKSLVKEKREQLAAKAEAERLVQAEKAKAEKQAAIEQSQKEGLRKQDEAAWEAAKEAAENAKDERGKIAAYRVYLDDPEHVIHIAEAEKARETLKKAEITRKISKEAIEREQREKQEMETARLKDLPEMVFVKGGTFQMGSNDYENEKPIHPVTLSDFEIGKYPVTQKLWLGIMRNNPSHFTENENCPVEQVSWESVQEFLEKLNARFPYSQYRLPTEAEWEYAARGGTLSKGFQFAGSDNLDEVAWFRDNAGSKTHPVGLKKANELGIHDMSGNVWEWCSDWYGTYASGSQTNPQGPSSGSYRVIRGGSWGDYPKYCRVSHRYSVPPGNRGNVLGFRLARTI